MTRKTHDHTPTILEKINQSRRHLLRTATAGLLTLAAAPALLRVFTAHAAETGGKNMLIVYYSHSGNTRAVAEHIHKRLAAQLLELKTAHSYPDAYRPTTEQARRELDTNFRPQLTTDIDSLESFQTLFIGYPSWWGTMPMALFSFLEKHTVGNRTLAPFCTHEGSGLGRSVNDLTRLCPQANIMEGLAVRGSAAAQAQDSVDSWLKRIGMTPS